MGPYCPNLIKSKFKEKYNSSGLTGFYIANKCQCVIRLSVPYGVSTIIEIKFVFSFITFDACHCFSFSEM